MTKAVKVNFKMVRKKLGLLTELQFKVLKFRTSGFSQEKISKILGSSRQNSSMTERRGRRNIRLAEETLTAYKEIVTVVSLKIESGTHLVDVPRMVIDAADKTNVRLRADFTRIYNMLKYMAPDRVKGDHIIKPVTVLIMKDGDVDIGPSPI